MCEMEDIDFLVAFQALLDGKRITRREWHDNRHYCLLKDEIVQLHKAGESNEDTHPWIISEHDCFAFDWVILDDKT